MHKDLHAIHFFAMDWEVVHEMAEEEEAKKLRKILVKEIFCNIHPMGMAGFNLPSGCRLSVYIILNIITWYHFSSKICGPSQDHKVKRGNSR